MNLLHKHVNGITYVIHPKTNTIICNWRNQGRFAEIDINEFIDRKTATFHAMDSALDEVTESFNQTAPNDDETYAADMEEMIEKLQHIKAECLDIIDWVNQNR